MFRQFDDGSFASLRRSIIILSIVAIAVAYWELKFIFPSLLAAQNEPQEISHTVLSRILVTSIFYLLARFFYAILPARDELEEKMKERISLTFKDAETAMPLLQTHTDSLRNAIDRMEELDYISGIAPELLLFDHEKATAKHDVRVEG